VHDERRHGNAFAKGLLALYVAPVTLREGRGGKSKIEVQEYSRLQYSDIKRSA